MPAKSCTSSKNKKHGVYVDQSALVKESNVAFLNQMRAKRFANIRTQGKKKINSEATVAKKKKEEEEEEEEEGEGEEAEEGAEEEEGEGDEGEKAGDASMADLPSSSSDGADAFSVSFAPFVASHSACVTSSAPSELKDDKILGVALWEWLLNKLDWDCHSLWAKFLVDWDLVTETERPPGTNRPVNLHSYLTFLRSTNTKHMARKDLKIVRETLERERKIAVRDNPEDPLALPNLQALNGSLLTYYLKIKNLIPYESDTQRKKKANLEKRKRNEENEAAAAATKTGAEGEEEEEASEQKESTEGEQQKKKKSKQQHAAPPAAAAAAAASTYTRPTPPKSSLKLGQANAFAALLDCD